MQLNSKQNLLKGSRRLQDAVDNPFVSTPSITPAVETDLKDLTTQTLFRDSQRVSISESYNDMKLGTRHPAYQKGA